MNVEGMVKQLEKSGVCFLLNGDRVRLRAPAGGRLPPDMLQALRREKTAVLEYLRARADRSLVLEMKEPTRDAFWRAARPAGREIESLPHLGEAMAWLRQSQPKAHWQLSDFWVERLRNQWEAGNLPEFQKSLRVWVQLHREVCGTFQLVRALQKR